MRIIKNEDGKIEITQNDFCREPEITGAELYGFIKETLLDLDRGLLLLEKKKKDMLNMKAYLTKRLETVKW